MSTLGLICPKRSRTAAAPKSGEQQDQIAPTLAQARKATTASTEFGRYAPTLSPGATPKALSLAAREEVILSSSPHVVSFSDLFSALATTAGPSCFIAKTRSAKFTSAP